MQSKTILYLFFYALVCLTMGDAYGQQSNSLSGPAVVCPGQDVTYYHYGGSSNCYVSSWSVSSNATVLQYSYGTVPQFIKVRFNTSGTGWVTATVPGSQYCFSQTRNVQIGLQSVGNISGPTYVYCNNPSATFSIPPVVGAASYTWTVSGTLGFSTSLATYSNGGATVTFPAASLSSGSGTVSVTVNPNCSSGSVTKSKSVYRAEPDDAITGTQSVCPYREYTYYAPSGAYNCVWQVFAPNQPEQPTITYSSSNSATIRFPGSGGGYIQLTYTNACGSSNRVLTYRWGTINCGFGAALAEEDANVSIALYPNPGSNLVKVTAKDKAAFTAKVYSPLNELVAQARGKGGEATLRVADLPEGIYYVHLVTDKGTVSRKRLIVKKQ